PETAIRPPYDSRQPQRLDGRLCFVVPHLLASPHLPVQRQQCRHIPVAAQEPLAHEQQVIILYPRPWREEQLLAQPVHERFWILDFGFWIGVLGDCLAEPLREVRMTAGPAEDALEERASDGRLAPQARRQRRR